MDIESRAARRPGGENGRGVKAVSGGGEGW